MSAAQGFARVRISQFHIVLACFSCIPPEQGLHLRYTESCPSGRRCSTRNAVSRKASRVRIPNSPPKTQSYQGFCPYDWAFRFSQGHISVHDFRQELRCASRSALCPAESGYCPLHLPSIFALVTMCLMVMVSRSKSSACVENRSSSVGKVKSDFLIVLSSLSYFFFRGLRARPNECFCAPALPGVKTHCSLRRHKLRILRFAASGKTHSLRCSSSPQKVQRTFRGPHMA